MKTKIHSRIRIEEWYAVTLSFLYCFCILAAYYILRPIRDQMAVEVGSSQLPWFFGATFMATLILTPLFSWIVSRWPRRIIMPIVYIFFMSCQFIFILIWNDQNLLSTRNFGLLFFVWVSVFNLFVVSVFWSFMTDIWNDEQARRLFPIIALGGTLGAVSGPLITKSLVNITGLAYLLLVSMLLLCIAVICIKFLGNWAHRYGANRNKINNEAALGGGMLDGLKQIFTNSFIGNMSLMMLLNDAIGTIAYVLVTDYSGMTFPNDPIAQTSFAASMDLAANLLQIILQLTLSRWLLVHFGAGIVFALCSCIVVITSLSVTFSTTPYVPIVGAFPLVAIVMIISRSLAHSMIQSARETLYTLVPRNLRYKGKNAVETFVWRAGDVASLISITGFRSLGVNTAGFGVIWAALAAVSGIIGWHIANRVENGEFKAG